MAFSSSMGLTLIFLTSSFDLSILDSLFRDFKTSLQELTQASFGITPEYKVISSRGPDHKKEFEVGVFIEGKEYARAVGKSKTVAQQIAAEIAGELLKKEK